MTREGWIVIWQTDHIWNLQLYERSKSDYFFVV